MAKRSEFKSALGRIGALPKERREKIEAEAAAILSAHHLVELRKAMAITQTELAAKTGMQQGEISRIERSPESTLLKTIDRYVRGLGGQTKIVAEFPDGTSAEIPITKGKPAKSRLSTVPATEDDATKSRPAT